MKKLVVLLIILSTTVYGAIVPSTFCPSTRALGMGGAFSAVPDDYNMLQYNPAMLSNNPPFHIAILALNLQTNQSTYDFANWLVNNINTLQGNFSSWSTDDLNNLLSANIYLNVSDNFSVTGINTPIGNFGFGLFAQTTINADVSQELLDIDASVTGDLDFVLPVSYGIMLDIPDLNDFCNSTLGGGKFGVGATVKFIQRYSVTEDESIFSISGLDPSSILNQLETPEFGFGFDVAANYYLKSADSTFALVCRDIYTQIGSDTVSSDWVFGYAYKPNWVPGIPILLAFDMEDLFGSTTILDKIHIGAEVNLMGILVLRGGFYQGWSSFGFSLFGLLDYADYGVEAGLYAGEQEIRYHRLTITLGI